MLVEQVIAAVAGGGDANAIDALALRSRIAAAEVMATDLRRMAIDAEEDARVRLCAERLSAGMLIRRAQRAQAQAQHAERVADDVTTRGCCSDQPGLPACRRPRTDGQGSQEYGDSYLHLINFRSWHSCHS